MYPKQKRILLKKTRDHLQSLKHQQNINIYRSKISKHDRSYYITRRLQESCAGD